MRAFYQRVVSELASSGALPTTSRVLVVCGGALDRDVFRDAGFRVQDRVGHGHGEDCAAEPTFSVSYAPVSGVRATKADRQALAQELFGFAGFFVRRAGRADPRRIRTGCR